MIFEPEVQTLAALPLVQAERYASRPALSCDGVTLSFGELADRVSRWAGQFHKAGVRKDSRVALLAKDGLDYVAALLGAISAGATVVPINWRLSAGEIAYIVSHSESKVVVAGAEYRSHVAQSLPAQCSLLELEKQPQCQRFPPNDVELRPEDSAVQMYTSGTTGHPKGVVLNHASFFAIAREYSQAGQRFMGWSASDVSLNVVPLFHIGGLWWVIRGLASGSHTVLLKQFVGWRAIDAIGRYGVTKAAMVPAMIRMLLSEPDCESSRFDSLQTMLYGGSPCEPALLNEAMGVLDCEFVQIYGLTESGNMAVCLPAEQHNNPNRLLSAGKAAPGVQLKVVDSDGNEVPPATTGEICIRTPALMREYWKNPAATREAIRDGWLHTGDAGYMDDEGFLYISDRIKDMICVAGENVYPAEVERVLAEHPLVLDVAVVGVPDPNWGESIKAVVVPRNGERITQRQLRDFCSGRLAGFRVPSSLDLVDALPRTPSGKVRKYELRARYWQGRSRNVG